MKPLNRPMFRYGGPIKEGVMSGIREPRQNYNEAGRVENFFSKFTQPALNPDGSPVTLPKRNFVEDLTFVAGPGKFLKAGGAGLNAIRQAGKYALKNDDPFTVGKELVEKVPFLSNQYFKQVARPYLSGMKETFSGVGGKIKDYGYVGTIGGLGTGYGIKKLRDLFNANKKNKEIDTTLDNIPNGPFVNTDKNTSVVSNQTTDNRTAKEIQADRIQRYRDIMDIKGMNKTAAYNSLIAASQAINESGDFKGDIKSGKLINKIIGAANKQFEKPRATKDAIDTLILKGEIEKDIKASDPAYALDAELKRTKIAESKRALNPSWSATKSVFGKTDKSQAGIISAAKDYSARNNTEYRETIVSKADFDKILKNLKKEDNTIDEITHIAGWTQGKIKGRNVPDGNYVVGDNIVTIVDNIVKAVE